MYTFRRSVSYYAYYDDPGTAATNVIVYWDNEVLRLTRFYRRLTASSPYRYRDVSYAIVFLHAVLYN